MSDEVIEIPAEQPELLGAAGALAGLVKPETLAGLQKMEAAKQETEQGESQKEPEKQIQKEENKEGEQAVPESKEKEVPAKEKEEKIAENASTEKKSKFGFDKSQKAASAAEVTIENPDQLVEAVNKKFGQNLKSIQDMPKFFESVSKMRADAQKYEEAQKKTEEYKNFLSELPDDLLDGIRSYAAGEDYTKHFTSKPKFDYSKPAEKQDIKELVNHYFPGKFTDEDFTEETKSAALEIAMSSAVDKFNVEKQTKDGQRVAAEKNAQLKLESIKKSVSDSVSHLKQAFPDMEDVDLQEAGRELEGGPQGVLGLFFNQDGTVKPEAAKMLMLAKYGETELQRVMGVASKITESRVNEDMVSRGADRPNPTKQHRGVPETVSEETKKLIADLGTFKKSSTY
jgi:hypothetical protein